MIYVTLSFQCPLGLMMSLPRRFELLRIATEKNAWILEDDYFSEYRYGTNPVASLQSLDRNERVIYIGNFSKSIVSFLRIGFMIVPSSIVNIIRTARSTVSQQPPGVDQAALAEFIGEGHLERHIRATLQIYRERPDFVPHMKESKFLSKFRGQVWVDKNDMQLAKMDIEVIDTVSLGWVLARIHEGTHVMLEQTRVNDEVWLPRHLSFKLDARIALFKGYNIDGDQTFRDYKKFRTSTKILGYGEVKQP